MKIYINFLGSFEVTDGERSLLEESSKKYKLHRLIQYFVTFRGKKLLPETIIDHLFNTLDYSDPKNVLRTQIFRLRQAIREVVGEDVDASDYIEIDFLNGYYSLRLGPKVVLDIDEFERLIGLGDESTIPSEAEKYYYAAIQLYRGEYMSGVSHASWLVYARNFYRRMYLRTLYRLIEILKEGQRYGEIVEICEHALIEEDHEENLHLELIESMINLGEINNAKNHYDYMISILEKEIGIKSHFAVKSLRNKIENYYNDKPYIDEKNLDDKLSGKEGNGALLCERDHFKSIYDMQIRRKSKTGLDDYLLLIDLNRKISHRPEYIKLWGEEISQVLKNSLRMGDVFTFWHETQILVLLYQVKYKGIWAIEKRILDRIEPTIGLHTKIKSTKLLNIDILMPYFR